MIVRIALRNALRQKRRTLLTALTMLGGFTLASISIGWSRGTYSHIIDMFTRNRLGHIQIHGKGYLDRPSLYNTIKEYGDVGRRIEGLEGIECWAPRLYAAGLVSVGEKSAAVQVMGIDPQREQEATHFDQKIVKGSPLPDPPSHTALLGKGLAEILHAEPGDEAVIVSQAADGSIANDRYRIGGIVESGDEISDRAAFYLHLADAQELFVLGERVHEIAIIVQELDQVHEQTHAIRRELNAPDLSVDPWQVFAKSFYQAMKADLQGMWIMIFVIILIVAVGVLNTVLMSVLERTREYGVLKAMGTRPRQVFGQVLLETNVIAGASILGGGVLSLLINHILSIQGISLPTPFTYGGVEFRAMYSEINAQSLYIPALTVLLSASLVSLFPGYRAARIRPARAMRA
jgi:ABC-type lipoprotein release transport system permease subunit